MPTHPFPIEYPEGKTQTLQIEIDPTWGDVKKMLTMAQVTDSTGNPRIDGTRFIDVFLETCIVGSDGDFKPKDRTFMAKVPFSVMSKLIGGVMELVPLKEYLGNMEKIQEAIPQ